MTPSVVYLNGEYPAKGEAVVSVEDRGFLLADGVYEVTPAYRGRLYRLEEHMERLRRGLEALRIRLDVGSLGEVHRRLLRENDLLETPAAKVYVQVTRGAAPRAHAFPDPPPEPTVYAYAEAWSPPPPEAWERGFAAATVPDRRWSRVDLKTIALLPNVLAQQAARDRGADEAIFVRDGVALEGAHANLAAVRDGVLVSHPETVHVLPGVTRRVVLSLARREGIPVEERPLLVEELGEVDELFLTGTTTEVRPLVSVDGAAVGTGTPGPVTRRLFAAYRGEVGGEAPSFPEGPAPGAGEAPVTARRRGEAPPS